MVHSHYSFEIRQVRSHLFLIRQPHPRYSKKIRSCKDRDELLKEISKLESVPEIISRIDDYVKQLKEEIKYLDLAKALVAERIRIRSIKIEAIKNLKQTLLREKKD